MRSKNCSFTFIGTGTKLAKLEELRHLDIEVNIVDPKPFGTQLDLYDNFDVSLISLSPGMYGLAVPSKFYFSISAGKPVLCLVDEGSEIQLVMAEHELGWCNTTYNAQSISQLLDNICTQNNYLEFSCSEIFYKHFNKDRLLKKIVDLIDAM